MFRGLINSAKNAANNLVVKYLARASVAVPFVVAAGFALAGLTLLLSQRFGSLTAYWTMAGALCLVGLIAAAIVSSKEDTDEADATVAAETDLNSTVSDAAAQAISQAPIALLGSIFAIPGGPATAWSGARLIGRNWPIALLVLVVGGLLWPPRREPYEKLADEFSVRLRPNGMDRHPPTGMRH
jgi:hypothetical protein